MQSPLISPLIFVKKIKIVHKLYYVVNLHRILGTALQLSSPQSEINHYSVNEINYWHGGKCNGSNPYRIPTEYTPLVLIFTHFKHTKTFL